jgi:hypothetical protein
MSPAAEACQRGIIQIGAAEKESLARTLSPEEILGDAVVASNSMDALAPPGKHVLCNKVTCH